MLDNYIKLLFESGNDVVYDPSSQTGLVSHDDTTYSYSVGSRGLGEFRDEQGQRVLGDIERILSRKLSPVKHKEDLEHWQNLQKQALNKDKSSSDSEIGIGSYSGNIPDWLAEYDMQFEELEREGRLADIHPKLDGIFKDAPSNYRVLIDKRDFVAILPTPASFIRSSPYRGVYVFRKVAGKDIPSFAISSEDRYTVYIPKIASRIESDNLLDIRAYTEKLGLGMFFRRDKRLNTITSWLPDPSFSSYDELSEYSKAFVESNINKACRAINEALRQLKHIF